MPRRRSTPYVPAEPQPVAELNTTPLIDVLLVLLVMLILVVPVMTHKVRIDLPSGPPHKTLDPVIYRLNLDSDGGLSWNGARVDEATLPARLTAVRHDPAAELQLSADGTARYENYDRILATVKRAGIKRLGFVGNERFAGDLDR